MVSADRSYGRVRARHQLVDCLRWTELWLQVEQAILSLVIIIALLRIRCTAVLHGWGLRKFLFDFNYLCL